MFWVTKVPCSSSVCDFMGLRICLQGKKSAQKIWIKEASRYFPSKYQRHLQALGFAVGVMCAKRSVETGEKDSQTPSL